MRKEDILKTKGNILKKILIITDISKCKLCTPITQLLSKNGFKVYISDCDKAQIHKNMFENFIEIVILLPSINIQQRAQFCSWLYKNYPNKIYFSYVPFSLSKELDILECPLYRKNKCKAIFLIYDVFTQPELLVSRIKYYIKRQYFTKIGEISYDVLKILNSVTKKVGNLPMFKKEISFYSSYLEVAEKTNQIRNLFGVKIVDLISKKFLADKISLFLYNPSLGNYTLVASKNYEIEDKNTPVVLSNDWKFVKQAIEQKTPLMLQNGTIRYPKFKKLKIKPQPDMISSLVIPLVIGENVVGILNVGRLKEDKERFTNYDLTLLLYITKWIGYIYSIIISFELNVEYNKLKDDFISIINHELRTPLMALSASFELLEGKIPSNIEDIVKRNIKRLNSMIEELLDFSRIGRGTLKVIEKENTISTLIKEIQEEYYPILKNKNIEFIVDTNLKTDKAIFDYHKLKQVLANLINNSIKFFPKHREHKYVKLKVEEKEQHFHFCVEDNGKGIPKSELKKVFLPFVQVGDITTEHKQGLGLGLAISKEIVKQHKGKIYIESKEGEWTKVHLLLPKSGGGGKLTRMIKNK